MGWVMRIERPEIFPGSKNAESPDDQDGQGGFRREALQGCDAFSLLSPKRRRRLLLSLWERWKAETGKCHAKKKFLKRRNYGLRKRHHLSP
jgi:hypothetical protein